MYLIIIQKHSIIFHLPLPQKYLGGGGRQTLKDTIEETFCVCWDQN